MKTLYLIGGAMGVGKSTVAQRLRDALPAAVMLDGDWCWSADPFIVTDETRTMVLDNICHVLGNFLRCSAYENVVFCWVMHEQAIIDAIRANLPLAETGCRVVNISLTCSEAASSGAAGTRRFRWQAHRRRYCTKRCAPAALPYPRQHAYRYHRAHARRGCRENPLDQPPLGNSA